MPLNKQLFIDTRKLLEMIFIKFTSYKPLFSQDARRSSEIFCHEQARVRAIAMPTQYCKSDVTQYVTTKCNHIF
jgi:hypothetical protein